MAGTTRIVALPDGRLAMGISAACDHCVSRSRWSGTIVSFRPDGSGVRLYASGIRAPFGLAYDQATGALLTSMNQRDDLGAKTPGDWLALVREGQNWRFPGCYGQGGSACRGVPEPLAVLDKHAAAGGVAIVSGQLGERRRPCRAGERVGAGRRRARAAAPLGRGLCERHGQSPLLTGFKHPLPRDAWPPTEPCSSAIGRAGKIYRIARV